MKRQVTGQQANSACCRTKAQRVGLPQITIAEASALSAGTCKASVGGDVKANGAIPGQLGRNRTCEVWVGVVGD